MHARFKLLKAVERCKIEILGLEGAEEALDHRVVEAVPSATHALSDAVMRKHRSVWLHLVVPALVRMHTEFSSTF